MLHYRFDKENLVLTLLPEGSLSESDFSRLSKKIDPLLETDGPLKGIIIEAEDFPYWQDFDGLLSHFKFVKDHHKSIRKVATVSNSKVLKSIPAIANHFVHAQVKSFDAAEAAAARKWVLEESASMEMVPFENQPVVGIRVKGKLTKSDIIMIEEAVDAKLDLYEKLSVYVEIEKFSGLTWQAFWEDLKYGLPKWRRFSKKAVVSQEDWVKNLYKIAGDLVPGIKVKHFSPDEVEKAKKWVKDIDAKPIAADHTKVN